MNYTDHESTRRERGRQPAPVRLVSRLGSEAGLTTLHNLLALVPGRFETAVVLNAVVRTALGSLVRSDGFALPSHPVSVGSIKGLSRSFDKPVTTMRRHAQTLAKLNYLTVAADGLYLAPDPAAGARVLAFVVAQHDLMLWLVSHLDTWKLLRRAPARAAGLSHERVARAGLDLMLLPFESFRGAFGSWTAHAVWNTLSTASVRRISADSALGARYIDQSTPDKERRPIGLRALSEASGLPYATVWRHVAALQDAGLLAQRDDGYAVLTAQLRTEAMEARVGRYVQQMLARSDELVMAGLDPRMIGNLYLGPPPGLVPIRGADDDTLSYRRK